MSGAEDVNEKIRRVMTSLLRSPAGQRHATPRRSSWPMNFGDECWCGHGPHCCTDAMTSDVLGLSSKDVKK